MTTALIVGVIIGLVVGYWAGIVRAEVGVARSQMKRTWSGRNSWRN